MEMSYISKILKIFYIAIGLALLPVLNLQSQTQEQVISLSIHSSVNKFKSSGSYPIAVEVDIKEPYHINSPNPLEPYLIPTTLEIKESEGIASGRILFPKSVLKKFAFSDNPLAVFKGKIFIFTNISISPDFADSELSIEGKFGYQACDDHTCLAPSEYNFSQQFPVAATEEKVVPINQSIFASMENILEEKYEESSEGDPSIAQTIVQKGWLLTFILVFLAGLALNLTPCVYPLIPITISYFGGQSEGKRGSVISHAILYILGMAITYSILGVIAALTGSLFGSALQNPVVLVIIAIILVSLALSMFDLYEIRIPAFLSNFAGGLKKGYFGTFFMGLTVGIVAAPCIGPFVLALLTFVGERGDIVLGFWLFFTLAIGLGLPFLFLAIFSGNINKIPKSGAWMVWVRNIFGFVLLAMAIYFLQPLFPNTLLYHLALALTMLVGGIYMAWIEPTKTSGKIFGIIRNLIGLIFFLLALLLGGWGIESFIDNKISGAKLTLQEGSESSQIEWFEYSDAIRERASKGNKPVLIDFYADWCIPCKELDKFTFSASAVVELSRQFTMLKVDLTQANDPLSQNLRKKFNIKGVPTLVFLSADGKELTDLRVVGFLEKEEFLPMMQKALVSGKN
jgi:thiol:disulfide interchange protein DsbD